MSLELQFRIRNSKSSKGRLPIPNLIWGIHHSCPTSCVRMRTFIFSNSKMSKGRPAIISTSDPWQSNLNDPSAQFIPGLFPSTNRPIYLVFIWVTECFVRVFFRVNILLHWLHLNNFSPVCVLKCLCKSETSLQTKSHWLHLFGFSPVCVIICLFKVDVSVQVYSH